MRVEWCDTRNNQVTESEKPKKFFSMNTPSRIDTRRTSRFFIARRQPLSTASTAYPFIPLEQGRELVDYSSAITPMLTSAPSHSNRSFAHINPSRSAAPSHPYRKVTSHSTPIRPPHTGKIRKRTSNSSASNVVHTPSQKKASNSRVIPPTLESGAYEDLLEFFQIQTTSDNEDQEDGEEYSPANIYGFESYIIDTLDGELDDAFADMGF